ncbi:RNA-binding protein 1-like isoform X6 [Macrobrachium rosenbergii]|uniref:RNA-binding protein 1-like isoform X6 n=1 Tax=Macrobrachium rosenbergii TaxID=79674 RepID=UPI0034D3BBB2
MPPNVKNMRTDCKVYVGNLGNTDAKHELESAFSKYGPLVNVWVARNPPGFAFVEFEDPRDAEDAVRALDGTRMCGVRVKVEMSTGRSRRDRFHSPPRRGGGGRRSRSRSPRRYGGRGRSRSRSPRRSRSRSPRGARRGSPSLNTRDGDCNIPEDPDMMTIGAVASLQLLRDAAVQGLK